MNTCKKQLVTRGALLLLILITSAPPATGQPPAAQLPALAELKDGWNILSTRSQLINGFELVKIWATISKSLILNGRKSRPTP